MDLPQMGAWDAIETPAGLVSRLTSAVKGTDGLSYLRVMAVVTTLMAVVGAHRPDYDRGSTIGDARQLLSLYCGALGLASPLGRFSTAPSGGVTLAELFLRAVSVDTSSEAIAAVNFALVLCADHELSPATFAARVAASTGADLRACLLSAIAAHSGVFLAGGCNQSEALLRNAKDSAEMHERMLDLERSGGRIPGYNIKSYPQGDPRARRLITLAAELGPKGRRIQRLIEGVETEFDLRPSLEVGLVALANALNLPARSASAIWSIGRSAGWVAHVIEQRQAAYMIRPRVQYVGPNSL